MLGKANFAGDNVLLYRLRWVLFAWMGAAGIMRWGHVEMSGPFWLGLMGLFVATQFAMLKLPATWVASQRFHTVVFLMDLSLVLAILASLGRLTQDLTLAISLTVFTTALAQGIGMAAVVAVVSVGIYIAFLSRGGIEFDPMNVDQMLDLPFIFIQGLHGAVIVTEMRFRQELTEALAADNKSLQRKLGSSLVQLREQAGEATSWVESIPAAAMVLNAVGEIQAFNSKAEEIFELRRSLVMRRPLAEVPFFQPLRQILDTRSGEGAVGVAEFRTKSGKIVAMAVRAGVSRDNESHLRNIGIVFGPWTGPLPAGAVLQKERGTEAPGPQIQPIAETVSTETA